MDKTKQDVLSTNVVVVEHSSFLLRQNDNATGPICKALKHGAPFFCFASLFYALPVLGLSLELEWVRVHLDFLCLA
jgi:hypothetical protein